MEPGDTYVGESDHMGHQIVVTKVEHFPQTSWSPGAPDAVTVHCETCGRDWVYEDIDDPAPSAHEAAQAKENAYIRLVEALRNSPMHRSAATEIAVAILELIEKSR